MAVNKSGRVDEWKSKPNKMRIAAMRIVWGENPITAKFNRRAKAGSQAVNADQNLWLVPSETTSQRYTVNLARKSCSCPFWRDKKTWCKHLEAARVWKARVRGEKDGSRMVALEPVPNPYKQEPWYDALTEKEEEIVRELARCLGAHFGITRSENRKNNAGNPGYALGDFLACGIVAGYNNKPSRKAIPMFAVETGLVRGKKPPDPPTLRAAMKRPAMRDAARRAQRMIATCTNKIDTAFSIDATVMKTPLSKIHLKRKAKGKETAILKILNCKVHLAIGIDTFVVYGVSVTDGEVNDQRAFIPTMEQVADFARIDVVLADAGYDDSDHFEWVGERGGRPYINITTGRKPQKGKETYNKYLAMWEEQTEEWLDAYPYRWLSESANSSYKRTIKRVIRARYEETREVEVLLATLAFSLKWLAHARAKHHVDIPWADSKALALIDDVVERCKGRRKPKPEQREKEAA